MGEIGNDFKWTKKLQAVGATGFQAPCGPSYLVVKGYLLTLDLSNKT